MDVAKDLITIDRAADILDVSVVSIQKFARSGELKGAKIGGKWRFKESDVQKYIDDKFI